MSETSLRVSLRDFNAIPLPEQAENGLQPLRIVTLDEFVSVSEETAEPLLGTSQSTILPRSGRLLMYGDGGAGKTTLSIDAAAHIASGTPWVGIHVAKPLRVLIIENEGPRGKFRERLGEKIASWQGAPFSENVFVLEEPWTRFTFEEEEHRMRVALFCSALEVDILMVGPLATIGMIGGGTPDEIKAFTGLLDDLNARSLRAFGVWIIHHENKAGDVSGAWERAPDTLLHVQAQGNGFTRLYWDKTRWSDEHHKTTLDLVWAEGRSFRVHEPVVRDPYEDMLEAFRKDNDWRTAKEAGELIKLREKEAKKVLAELVRRGHMRFEKGPQGRHATAQCWRLEGAPGSWAHLGAPTGFQTGGGAPDPSPLPFRGGRVGAGTNAAQPEDAPKDRSTSDEEPPF